MKKPPTSEQLTASAWAAALSTSIATDQVPPGFFTAKQIALKMGKAYSTIGTNLCRAVAEGRCERQSYRIATGSVVRPVPHYRLK